MAYRKMLRELREIREAQGITHEQVAKVVGVHRSYIVRFENGERSPNLPQFMNWCKALGAKPSEVFKEVDDQ